MVSNSTTSSCPICNGATTHGFSAKNYAFSRCVSKDCGHIFVDPIPSFEELDVYYAKNTSGLENSDSWTMADDYASNPQLVHDFYSKNRIRFLRNRGYLSERTSVLDVGCSTGMFLRVLKDQGNNDVCGVDVSIEQVAHCQDINQIRAFRDLNQIPTGEQFDLVCLYAVLEHVPNPREVMRDSVERLSIGGRLIVDVPNYRSLYRVLTGKQWLWLIPPVHLGYFSPKSMRKLAATASLEIDYRSTKSTSTYTYILLHHVFAILGKELPSTSLSASSFRAKAIFAFETIFRFLLSPVSILMRLTGTHNQIIYVFKKN
jgi:2-polyprenyl-3-methyl-5-hydroxy-6-metoxy-1,4-benzoquinol methylase